ncbi:hypothetical protein [Mycolicibacterium baixiangningiae]|uniref:hypothetical protein n=1 Tax=Mycolicibacterium baixiangningiae TaxID=2761578 RepID=UPI001865B395|nr:hypothetical protein [Mycolicibacterium baixiangningiae]
MIQVKRAKSPRKDRSFRYGVAAVALCAGFAAAPAPAVAWADSTDSTVSDSTPGASSHAGPAGSGSSRSAYSDRAITTDKPANEDPEPTEPPAVAKDETGVPGADPDPDADVTDTEAEADEPSDTTEPPEQVPGWGSPEPVQPPDTTSGEPVITEPVVPELSPPAGKDAAPKAEPVGDSGPVTKFGRAAREEDSVAVATPTPPAEHMIVTVARAQPDPTDAASAAQNDATAPALDAVIGPATVEKTVPLPPQPLSPIAELLEVPGRLVNALLQAFGFTASANSPESPITFAPINDAVFATFREIERLLGLHRTPAPQPAVPTLTYTGPTTRPTPTVAQFLNASAAGYVLGSTPGGLMPFTVDGFQMSSTNVFSGMVGRAWVTPEGQVIIAYQGTTGGTNLLFNPLITVSQIIADLQVVFTGTTPLAFYDALDFAERVQAEAAVQGYASDDIFVTGHSLGGWEAQFVAQQTGLAGIGFEAPGINTVVPGNGADSMFVNIGTYGSSAPYMSTDLPGLQPFMPPYVPGGGSKPHYGPIVMIGDPAAMTPLYNASTLWGESLIGSMIFLVDYLGNFFQYHLPGVQAYHLDVTPDPGVVLWLGTARGPVHTGYGVLTIPELMKAASDDGILFKP